MWNGIQHRYIVAFVPPSRQPTSKIFFCFCISLKMKKKRTWTVAFQLGGSSMLCCNPIESKHWRTVCKHERFQIALKSQFHVLTSKRPSHKCSKVFFLDHFNVKSTHKQQQPRKNSKKTTEKHCTEPHLKCEKCKSRLVVFFKSHFQYHQFHLLILKKKCLKFSLKRKCFRNRNWQNKKKMAFLTRPCLVNIKAECIELSYHTIQASHFTPSQSI